MVSKDTLVMVVDTNRPSYTECPELLRKTGKIVVFDHHRQSSEIIENPILSYIEPYASSACEMVAEVLQYFNDGVKINATGGRLHLRRNPHRHQQLYDEDRRAYI